MRMAIPCLRLSRFPELFVVAMFEEVNEERKETALNSVGAQFYFLFYFFVFILFYLKLIVQIVIIRIVKTIPDCVTLDYSTCIDLLSDGIS